MIEDYYGIMCLAWQDDDGYVELISPIAEKICLNRKLSLIWKTISEKKYKKTCIDYLLKKMTLNEINEGLRYLIDNRLVKEYRKDNIFNDLFA